MPSQELIAVSVGTRRGREIAALKTKAKPKLRETKDKHTHQKSGTKKVVKKSGPTKQKR